MIKDNCYLRKAGRSNGKLKRMVSVHSIEAFDINNLIDSYDYYDKGRARVKRSDSKGTKTAVQMLYFESREWYAKTDAFAEWRNEARRAEVLKNLDSVTCIYHAVTRRQQWGSKGRFLLAGICAVLASSGAGLIAEQQVSVGGIHWFICTFLWNMATKIPLLVFEIALGQMFQGSQLRAHDALSCRFRGLSVSGAFLNLCHLIILNLSNGLLIANFIVSLTHSAPWKVTEEHHAICHGLGQQADLCNSNEYPFCAYSEALSICMGSSIDKMTTWTSAIYYAWFVPGFSYFCMAGIIWLMVAFLLVKGIMSAFVYIALAVPIVFIVLGITLVLALLSNTSAGLKGFKLLYTDSSFFSVMFPFSLKKAIQLTESAFGSLASTTFLLTVASFNDLSFDVHQCAWIIFLCQTFASFLFLNLVYTSSAFSMDDFGVKDFNVQDMAAWLQKTMHRIIQKTGILPKATPSLFFVPRLFHAVSATNSAVSVLYFLMTTCVAIITAWAGTLPFYCIVEESKLLQKPKCRIEAAPNHSHSTFIRHRRLSSMPSEIFFRRSANNFNSNNNNNNSSTNVPYFRSSTAIHNCGRSLKVPRWVIALCICLPPLLLSLAYIGNEYVTNKVYTLQIFASAATLLRNVLGVFEALYAGWAVGWSEQAKFVGSSSLVTLAVSWIGCSIFCGLFNDFIVGFSFVPFVFAAIGSAIALLLCKKEIDVRYGGNIKGEGGGGGAGGGGGEKEGGEECATTAGKDSQGLATREATPAAAETRALNSEETFINLCNSHSNCDGSNRRNSRNTNHSKKKVYLYEPSALTYKKHLSFSQRAWWLFLGNIETLRASMNLAFSNDARRPIPFYWGVLLKYWCTPWLLCACVCRIMSFRYVVEDFITYSGPYIAGDVVTLLCLIFGVSCAILGFVIPRLFIYFLAERELFLPRIWLPKKAKREDHNYSEEFLPMRLWGMRSMLTSFFKGEQKKMKTFCHVRKN